MSALGAAGRRALGVPARSGRRLALTLVERTGSPRELANRAKLRAALVAFASTRRLDLLAPPCLTTLCVWRRLPYLTLPYLVFRI